MSSTADLRLFSQKIANNQLPISTESITIQRNYRNNDLFLDIKGLVYRLIDIDKLLKIATGSTVQLNDCFVLVGNIENRSNISNYITYSSNNRAQINKNYKGLDIFNLTRGTSYTPNADSVLNLVSNNDNNSGDIDFVNMDVVYGNSQNANMRIYYDKDQKAYHIDSSYPIMVDSNVYVNYTDDAPDGVDLYSKILTNNNSITGFYGICNQLDYILDTSVFAYSHLDSVTKYYGTIYIITLGSKDGEETTFRSLYDTSAGDILHFQKGSFQDSQKIRPNISKYYFKQNQEYINPYDALELTNDSSNDIMVSLIKNVEVYIDKKLSDSSNG